MKLILLKIVLIEGLEIISLQEGRGMGTPGVVNPLPSIETKNRLIANI